MFFARKWLWTLHMSGMLSEWVLDAACLQLLIPVTWDIGIQFMMIQRAKKSSRGGSWKDIAHYS